jgi:hypothetical protein
MNDYDILTDLFRDSIEYRYTMYYHDILPCVVLKRIDRVRQYQSKTHRKRFFIAIYIDVAS